MQRKIEWEKIDENGMSYHLSQWQIPKRSTISFIDFAAKYIGNSLNIIDMGAGAGAATGQMAKNFPNVNFTAFDLSKELSEIGKQIAKEKKVNNLSFECGDWFNYLGSKRYDGCISLQTLSWLPEFEKPLKTIFYQIKPNWIALTSLFYEGDISCKIEVVEHTRSRASFYNIYSLKSLSRFCLLNQYQIVKYQPFVIDIDLAPPVNKDLMGTFTRKFFDENNNLQREQFSGPLLMNWYMVLMTKIK